jgi:predicted deacylase
MHDTFDHDGLDRRNFMLASAASVGAAATVALNAAPANAQTVAQAVPDSTDGTTYTGDMINGKPVVTLLDVTDLAPGRLHRLYFRGVETPSGQYWHVSVTVARGASPGKRVVLTSGVHGDEMSSIQTVLNVMGQLDPAMMAGTVMAVTDIARPALEGMQRRWPNSGRGIDLIDMNREWPGIENGPTASGRHAWLVFNRLLRPNADVAIDFHTGTTGFEVTDFNIGEMRIPEVRAMLELYPVSQIADDPTDPGVLHNAYIAAGIPSFCPEVGAARVLDPDRIGRFVEGTMNVLKYLGIVAGPMGRTSADVPVFVGNAAFPILATAGGIVEYLVRLNDPVTIGQRVAIQRNCFGEVVAEYVSGVDGEVTGLRSDAMAEPGNPLAFILFSAPDPEEELDYPE